MAVKSKSDLKKKEPAGPDMKALSEEATRRLADARSQKNEARADLQEAYFFTRPRLCWNVDSTAKASRKRSEEQEDLATGIGAEVSEDFATEVISAFFPQGGSWVETLLPDADVDGLEEFRRMI